MTKDLVFTCRSFDYDAFYHIMAKHPGGYHYTMTPPVLPQPSKKDMREQIKWHEHWQKEHNKTARLVYNGANQVPSGEPCVSLPSIRKTWGIQ